MRYGVVLMGLCLIGIGWLAAGCAAPERRVVPLPKNGGGFTDDAAIPVAPGGPPTLEMAAGDGRQKMTRGSYCWGTVCVDVVWPPPLPRRSLQVDAGTPEVRFRLPGVIARPKEVLIRLDRLEHYQGEPPTRDEPINRRTLRPEEISVEETALAWRYRLPVLAPGEYAMEVSFNLPDGGAGYYGRLRVIGGVAGRK